MEWISVKDRLPEAWHTVLLWGSDSIQTGYINDKGKIIGHRWGHAIPMTHWMPLPQPPKVGVEGPDAGERTGRKRRGRFNIMEVEG